MLQVRHSYFVQKICPKIQIYFRKLLTDHRYIMNVRGANIAL